METIRIKYFSDAVPPLCQVDGKSDWIDLYAAQTITLRAGESALIPLGVAMAPPEGYEAHVAPRSSTFKTYGLLQSNGVGVVDWSYRGDEDQWKMPVYATRDVTVEAGSRICQFRIVRNQPPISFQVCEHLDGPSRGGFGSTGR